MKNILSISYDDYIYFAAFILYRIEHSAVSLSKVQRNLL